MAFSLRHRMPATLLAIACALSPQGLLAKPVPPAALTTPSGVTLTVRAPGKFTLYWDAIDADDLIGYSVWAKRTGEKEFTRLSVPVSVAGEIRKMPVTTEARLDLKLGVGRDMEFVVMGEYEDDKQSQASVVAFTRLATSAGGEAVLAPALAGAVPALTPAVPSSVKPLRPLSKALEDEEVAPDPATVGMPAFSPLLTPAGKLRTRLGLHFDFQRYIRTGRDAFSKLSLYGTGIDPAKVVNYNRIDVRTIFRVPLRASYGVGEGLEVWVEGAYHAEDVYIDDYYIDEQNFDFIRRIKFDSQGNVLYLSNPSATGIGDINFGVRTRLSPDVPLIVGLQGSYPSGVSRFKAAIDTFLFNEINQTGTGEGVSRFMLAVNYGEKATRSGLSLEASFKPSSLERHVKKDPLFGDIENVLSRGEELALGGGYTFPWKAGGKSGALVIGLVGRTVAAARWTVNGVDLIKNSYHPVRQNNYSANMDARFVRDDQLEISAELFQALASGLETGGRVYYRMQVFGDTLGIAGTFFY